ncbi:MAG: glycosyltransferase family 2 protein, partial [Alphaproteobacteria bacterium]
VERVPNAAASAPHAHRPGLTVLIPFYGSDPSALLRALDTQAAALGGAVDIVCADDGSPDRACAEAAVATAGGLAAACTVLLAGRNRGRSEIRNLLARQARGRHVLFLDGDMAVSRPSFLADYLDLLAREPIAIAFGGFEMDPDENDPANDLHVWSSRRDHCLPASERAREPEKYTYTSNLVVRRDLLLACPFSDAFAGWGWEDVDWAIRAARLAPIRQVENPAVHRGFSSAETLLRKYRESVPNFATIHARHPAEIEGMPLFRAARAAARLPLPELCLRLFAAAAVDRRRILPMRLRSFALKLYRAWLYRDVAAGAARGPGAVR